jgi:hypothetical protein
MEEHRLAKLDMEAASRKATGTTKATRVRKAAPKTATHGKTSVATVESPATGRGTAARRSARKLTSCVVEPTTMTHYS